MPFKAPSARETQFQPILRCLRVVVSGWFFLVLIAPLVVGFWAVDAGGLLLDAPPRGAQGILVYLIVLAVSGRLAWWTWRRAVSAVSVSATSLFALVLCILSALVHSVTSERMWFRLNARGSSNLAVHQVVVLARYATTVSNKSGKHTYFWLNVSHPWLPGEKITLSETAVPAALRATGSLACVNIYTGRYGWRWAAMPKACPAGSASAAVAPPGLAVLQPLPRDQVAVKNPAYGVDGFFDDEGRAWWLTHQFARGARGELAPANGEPPPANQGKCPLAGPTRLSSDTRTLLQLINLSRVGEPDPPPLPHWERLGRNVWVYEWSSTGHCTLLGSVLQPGWVLDADFHHDTRQLAVLSALRHDGPSPRYPVKQNLVYRVTLYSVDGEGQMQAQPSQPWGSMPLPRNAEDFSLKWQGHNLVLQDRLQGHRTIVRRGTAPASVGTPPGPEMAASAPPPPPLHGLPETRWRSVAQAQAAPIALYSHPDFGGGLLLNTGTGAWHYLPPFAAQADHSKGVQWVGFDTVQARLSADGRRLIACQRVGFWDPQRCSLLELPWPDPAAPG